jgi:hypothetical protein
MLASSPFPKENRIICRQGMHRSGRTTASEGTRKQQDDDGQDSKKLEKQYQVGLFHAPHYHFQSAKQDPHQQSRTIIVTLDSIEVYTALDAELARLGELGEGEKIRDAAAMDTPCRECAEIAQEYREASHLLFWSATTVRSPMIGSIINTEVAPLNGTQRVSTFRPPQLCTPFFKKLLVALRPLFVVLVAAGWMSISAATPGIAAHGQDPTSVAQQAPAPIPEFEVATIKPNKASDGMRLMAHTPTGLSVKNIPALFLIRDAFGLEDDRILGAPAWVNTDRFDIEAKVGESDIPRLKTICSSADPS